MLKKAFVYGLCIVLFVSCSTKSTNASFIAKLDEADVHIAYSRFSDAEKVLVAAEKMATSDIQYLSVYKRLYKMHKMAACEKVVKKLYKKYGFKPEIQALYTHFLLETKQVAKALSIGKGLVGTDYASLYAEALFLSTKSEKDFFTTDYVQAYIDAYHLTGNTAYSINAACLLAHLGRFREAMFLHPKRMTSYEPAYFWSLIAYDAGDFDTCIFNLSLLAFSEKHLLLEADAYLKAGLLDEANEAWLSVIAHDLKSPVSYLNAARASEEKGLFSEASQWLLQMLDLFPHFTPGLVEYAYYALRLEKQKSEDILTSNLELRGIKTLQNTKLEDYLQVPISDALWRIEKSLKEKEDIDLELEQIKLRWAADPQRSRAEKNAEVYALLERNYLGDSLYEEKVLQWALWYFLSQRQWKEAEQLFIPYLTTKYGEHSKDAKDEVVIVFDPYNRIAQMRSWEREYLSYFVAEYKKDLMLAYRLLVYEFENGQVSTTNEKKDFTQRDRLPLFINLGNMYFGLKQTEKAIELYSLASSQAKSDKLKSEIHYRLALVNLHKQEIKNALLNAEYSILLDSNNTEARLLYKKLKD